MLRRIHIVEQHAAGRAFGIVELAGAHGPGKQAQKPEGYQQGQGYQKYDDRHAYETRLCPNRRDATRVSQILDNTTVILPRGISRAAMAALN